MIEEDRVVAAVAEEGAAEFSDFRRGENPAGGFGVEWFELLEGAILGFGEQLDVQGGGEVQGGILGLVFLAGGERFLVVAEAAPAGGAFGGAIDKEEFGGRRGGEVKDIGLAAGGFHGVEGAEFFGMGGQAGGDGIPFQVGMAVGVFHKAGL